MNLTINKQLKTGLSDMKWISVEDRLPINSPDEMNGNYVTVDVIVTDGEVVDTAEFKAGNTREFWSGFEHSTYWTHWMPLPEPPNNTL